jgi:hypothetical protein
MAQAGAALEEASRRARDAEAEAERLRGEVNAWRTEVEQATAHVDDLASLDRGPGRSEDEDATAMAELRTEVERLTGELAIAIERRQTAEERLAAMTAELIAAQRAEDAGRAGDANGNRGGSAGDSSEATPWRTSPSRPREVAPADPYEGEDAIVAAAVGPAETGDDDRSDPAPPPTDEGADEIASLRSRLARTAAKKKSRSSMDRPRSS